MNAFDGEEAKARKSAGNYGVCKEKFLLIFPHPKKNNYLSVLSDFVGLVENTTKEGYFNEKIICICFGNIVPICR